MIGVGVGINGNFFLFWVELDNKLYFYGGVVVVVRRILRVMKILYLGFVESEWFWFLCCL